jgi:hypothetical protein
MIGKTFGSHTIACILTPYVDRAKNEHQEKMMRQVNMYSELSNDKQETRVKEFEERLSDLEDSEVDHKCGKWLRLKVAVDGVKPAIWRDLIVNPVISMQSLHNHVLCPVLGWKSYNHCYAFPRAGALFRLSADVLECEHIQSIEGVERAMRMLEHEVWIGPKKCNVSTTAIGIFLT